MSMLVVDPVEQRQKLAQINSDMQRITVQEEQLSTDDFLDKINSSRHALQQSRIATMEFTESLRELAWFSNVAQAELDNIAALITRAEKLSRTMVSLYISSSKTYQSIGLKRDGLREYKEAADMLKEAAVDLQHRFFDLPQDDEFLDLMQQLNEVA
jgi:hypothetical protein